jgi:hypothetical protein
MNAVASGVRAAPEHAATAGRPPVLDRLRRMCRRRAFLAVGASLLGCAVLPAVAPASLPDGRVYEQVSPANKNGSTVRERERAFGLAANNGDAAIYMGTGALGTAYEGVTEAFLARRNPSGWSTVAMRPRQIGETDIFRARPLTLVPDATLSSVVFTALGPYVLAEPVDEGSSSNIFLSRDPAVEPAWVAQPTIANAIPLPGQNVGIRDYLVTGGTPDFSTIFFTYSGTLTAQDASRAPYVGAGTASSETDPWGFYEWNEGSLRDAGVLPSGMPDEFGAVPAAIAGGSDFDRRFASPFDQAQTLDNQISTSGSRVFFVSPDPVASTVTDPASCASEPPCTTAPPELYAREAVAAGGKRTVLVSESKLPGHEGEPAPDGPVSAENTPIVGGGKPAGASYVYASADGTNAFFFSRDQLTTAAPADSSLKLYDANLVDATLTYLPGVDGPIATVAPDGSDLLFEDASGSPTKLELWTAGAGGGRVSVVADLPAPPAREGDPFGGLVDVSGARSNADGSAFAFRTNSPIAGFNDEGGFAEVYHYSVSTGEVACASCPPAGTAPSGDAHVSYNEGGEPMTTIDTHVISADGSRVFFDTPVPLVPQATNGKRDVYEWENGRVYLISSGKSGESSYLLDSSASGNDVFFRTSAALVPADLDNEYDVYDARVPQPGDTPAPGPAPCQAEGCRGSVGVLPVAGVPASSVFGVSGSLTFGLPAAGKPKTAGLTRVQKLARALRACRHRTSKRQRRRCEIQAKRRYGRRAGRPKARHARQP